MKEVFIIFISGFGALLLFSCVVFIISYFFEKKAAEKYQEVTGIETKYTVFGGCFVKTSSGWRTQEEYKAILVAKEGLQATITSN